MTLIVDAAPLIALNDRDDPDRGRIETLLRTYPGDVIVPAPVTAEVDYFLSTRFPPAAARAFLSDLATGNLHVGCLEPEDYATVLALHDRYGSLRPGLADLSIVVLAERYRTRRVVTFDHRHFRAIEPLQGGSFTLLPDDEGGP